MMNRSHTFNETTPKRSVAHTSIYSLGALFLSILSLACSTKTDTPNDRGQAYAKATPSEVSLEQAKILVAKNYNKIFTELYAESPLEPDKVQLPAMKAKEFRLTTQDPVYWHLSYEPEAGLWLEARVEKAHGTVEWVTVSLTVE